MAVQNSNFVRRSKKKNDEYGPLPHREGKGPCPEGNDPKESLHENLNVARKQIASSIRNANKRRIDIADEIQPKRPKSSKKKQKTKRKSVKYSVFNNG